MTHLTPREIEVCAYLCKGWNNKEVAQKLRVSPRTVEDHRTHILKKYRCRNLVELMIAVYEIPDKDAS